MQIMESTSKIARIKTEGTLLITTTILQKRTLRNVRDSGNTTPSDYYFRDISLVSDDASVVLKALQQELISFRNKLRNDFLLNTGEKQLPCMSLPMTLSQAVCLPNRFRITFLNRFTCSFEHKQMVFRILPVNHCSSTFLIPDKSTVKLRDLLFSRVRCLPIAREPASF